MTQRQIIPIQHGNDSNMAARQYRSAAESGARISEIWADTGKDNLLDGQRNFRQRKTTGPNTGVKKHNWHLRNFGFGSWTLACTQESGKG